MEVSTSNMVRDQLARILSSSQLSGSSVLSDFLTFIVNETLEGRGNELKEYTIGVHALRKEPDFNPQLDSIVRIHAGRLRRALKEYYYEEGSGDSIAINIPKGSYVPVFETRSTESTLFVHEPDPTDIETEQKRNPITDEHTGKRPFLAFNEHAAEIVNINSKPSIAVLPFKKIGGSEELIYFVKSISEYLCTELTQFDNLKVMSYYSSDYVASLSTDLQKIGNILETDYILTGSVHELSGLVRVCIQLNCCESGDQLWAHTFDKNESENHWQFQSTIVETVLAATAGINGSISRHEMKKVSSSPAEAKSVSSLTYWYNRFADSFDPHVTKLARQFYERVLKEEPPNSLAMAYLSNILSCEMALPSYKSKKENLAEFYAQTAIKIDPHCQQAYHSLALCFLIQHKTEDCLSVLEQGLALNPKSVEYVGGMAALMIYAGKFEEGAKILDKVIKLNPYLPWWQTLSYSYYSYYRDFYTDALFWADRIKVNVVWTPIIRTASYAQLDQLDKAQEVLAEFYTQYPNVRLSEPGTLHKFFYAEVFVNKLETGLAKLAV